MDTTPSVLYEALKNSSTEELKLGLTWTRQNYDRKQKAFVIGLAMCVRVLLERNRKEFCAFWEELNVQYGKDWSSR
jgi:hypothetical protein